MKEQKKMSLMQLTFIVAVNMMGSGIIMLPTNMAKVGRDLAALLDRDGARLDGHRLRLRPGRPLQPARREAWRPTPRTPTASTGYFITFYLYFLSLAIGNVAIAISAVGYLATFVPALSATPIATCIGVIALLWLTTVANFGGPVHHRTRSAR